MKKALIVTTTASMIDLFNMPNIHILQQLGYEVSVACNFRDGNSTSRERVEAFLAELDEQNVIHHDIDLPRSPFKVRRLLFAYRELKKLVLAERYELIHCHTPVGGFLTRLVGVQARRRFGTKVIYTAHGFHFYKGAPLKNWLLYFPVEWLCSFWTDVLITINREDHAFARKHLHAERTEYVPGVGIDIRKFSPDIVSDKERKEIREKLGIKPDEKMLLSVGELNRNKNHEIILYAMAELSDETVHYMVAGRGKLYGHLTEVAEKLGISERVHLLGYIKDVCNLYKAADIYILPSLREGLNVSIMEAMASKLPVICSRIRGNTDLIEDGKGGILCSSTKVAEYISAIRILIGDKNQMAAMGEYNGKAVFKYDTEKIMEKIGKIYRGHREEKFD